LFTKTPSPVTPNSGGFQHRRELLGRPEETAVPDLRQTPQIHIDTSNEEYVENERN
jgi:hypothetical protein